MLCLFEPHCDIRDAHIRYLFTCSEAMAYSDIRHTSIAKAPAKLRNTLRYFNLHAVIHFH